MKLASILEKVILAIQTYRTMLISQGFSSCEIHERLISLLQLTQSQLNDLDRNSQQSVQSLIQIYLGKHTSVVKAMTELLVNVEAQIILFKENIDEEEGSTNVVGQVEEGKKSRVEKKKNEKKKKKSKGCKGRTIDEMKGQAMAALEIKKAGLMNNLEQIKMLKNMLGYQMISQNVFQSQMSPHPAFVFSL